jgi:hypothetical protein
MVDDTIEAVFELAEQAYIKMQANHVLIQCLEEANLAPLSRIVESLVLEGPGCLSALQELVNETVHRKTQVEDDLQQVLNGLKTNLEGYGVHLRGLKKPGLLIQLRRKRVTAMLRSQGITDGEAQSACLQLIYDSRQIVMSLQSRIELLEEMAQYIEDWIMGEFYELMHRDQKLLKTTPKKAIL